MKPLTPEQERVNRWMLQRKVEAGAITALGLNELDSAKHACQIVQQVIDKLGEITEQLAKATNLPQIADALKKMSDDDKIDKTVLRQLKNEDSVAQTAAMFLLPVVSHIQDAQLKLQSTGWLSDRPPRINGSDLQPPIQKADISDKKPSREQENDKANTSSLRLEKDAKDSKHVDSCKPRTVEELESDLSKLKTRKKKLRAKMKARKYNDNTTTEEKASQLVIDEEKIAEIDKMIVELTAVIEQSVDVQENAALSQPPTPTKMYTSRLYNLATQIRK